MFLDDHFSLLFIDLLFSCKQIPFIKTKNLQKTIDTNFYFILFIHSTFISLFLIKLYFQQNRQSFFTCGTDEVRQWSIRCGFTAPEAAGTIHGDFQKHFICCETYAFKDWNKAGATQEATNAVRAAGKIRTEGKKYIMKDGDICFFKHNAGK